MRALPAKTGDNNLQGLQVLPCFEDNSTTLAEAHQTGRAFASGCQTRGLRPGQPGAAARQRWSAGACACPGGAASFTSSSFTIFSKPTSTSLQQREPAQHNYSS